MKVRLTIILGTLGILLVLVILVQLIFDPFKPSPTIVVDVPAQMIIYSIEPVDEPETSSSKNFHGYPILGQLEIEKPDQREALIRALNRGIRGGRRDGDLIKCFWPRHGIRSVRDGQTVDYLICFQCAQIVAFRQDETLHDSTDKSAQPLFNKILQDSGIKLPPQPK